MRYRYFEFNGQKFKFQDDLELAANFFNFILAYGDEALRAQHELERDPEQSDMLRQLLEAGILDKAKGRWRLTPRAVNAMQRKALMEVFAHLRKGTREGHVSPETGAGSERVEGTRPFEFGDPVSEIDLAATLKNTIRRMAGAEAPTGHSEGAKRPRNLAPLHTGGQIPRFARNDEDPDAASGLRAERRDAASGPRGGGRTERASDTPSGQSSLLPLRIGERDFERYNTESRTSCSTAVLIDQSGSMARFGRFFQAKKCAMALIALIRQRFPYDTVDLVGFASAAEQIQEEKLPLLMPKPVTMFDPEIRLRVPMNKLDQAPPHFTNLHMGLLLARRILARRSGENKMIFIITDGQPTAHVQGDYAYLLYPPHKSSHIATLKEAFLISKRDVRICTFALTDDYWDMDWLGFVDQLGRLTRGVTFNCTSGDLSACVMESYLSGRKRKTYIA